MHDGLKRRFRADVIEQAPNEIIAGKDSVYGEYIGITGNGKRENV